MAYRFGGRVGGETGGEGNLRPALLARGARRRGHSSPNVGGVLLLGESGEESAGSDGVASAQENRGEGERHHAVARRKPTRALEPTQRAAEVVSRCVLLAGAPSVLRQLGSGLGSRERRGAVVRFAAPVSGDQDAAGSLDSILEGLTLAASTLASCASSASASARPRARAGSSQCRA